MKNLLKRLSKAISNANWPIMVAGFTGGAAPILANMAKTLISPNAQLDFGLGNMAGLALFGALGAIVANYFEDQDRKKAFMMGISAPAMVTLMATSQAGGVKPPSGPPQEIQKPIGMFFFASTAYAQTPSPAGSVSSIQGRSLEVSTETTLHNLAIALTDISGKTFFEKKLDGRGFKQIDVPSSASSYVVTSELGNSGIRPLPSEAKAILYVSVRTETKTESDVQQIFGLGPKVEQVLKVHHEEKKRIPASSNGWIYLGAREGDVWRALYLDLTSEVIPAPGTKARTTFPLNLRPEPGGKDFLGVLRVKQKVRIDEIHEQEDGKSYWARIEVLE